ncbi:MAG: hypothetical protein JWN78_383 [Bacteroidota bacterium]|nr:hypothetical protein [Bacteroidota bacterium]
MKEHLLHFIWQNRLFNTKDLKTSSGIDLQILDFGKYNKDGGPDFWNAKIKIEDIIFIGNIELHIHASDWKLHRHHRDKKYDNVILHVVLFNDESYAALPTLELNGRISSILLEKYESMMLSRQDLICQNLSQGIDQFTIENWKERLVIERLERKSKEILSRLAVNKNDWEKTCYELCGKYFGSPVNKEPFELLTRFLDYKLLLKYTNDSFRLEALLFGSAGFLEKEFSEKYPLRLKKEYDFLKHKYHVKQMQEHQWQFLRMRPASFPTIRIAWFAQLLKQMPFFNKMISLDDPAKIFDDIKVSDYWKEHYIFDKPVKIKNKMLGDEFRTTLQINVTAPLLYAYGIFSGTEKYIDRAFSLLYGMHGEENNKTRIFDVTEWQQNNAFNSQALIELYDSYCTKKRCLECAIGHKILRSTI